MNIFPQLRKLEEKYANELAVVGVHSAKFNAEKATDNVRRAVMRYEIEHPVVNDAEFTVWQQYAVRAWPTLMFIGPDGRLVGKHEGEFPIEALDNVLANMVEEYDRAGELDRRPLGLRARDRKGTARPSPIPSRARQWRQSAGCSSRTRTTTASCGRIRTEKSAPSSAAARAG